MLLLGELICFDLRPNLSLELSFEKNLQLSLLQFLRVIQILHGKNIELMQTNAVFIVYFCGLNPLEEWKIFQGLSFQCA